MLVRSMFLFPASLQGFAYCARALQTQAAEVVDGSQHSAPGE